MANANGMKWITTPTDRNIDGNIFIDLGGNQSNPPASKIDEIKSLLSGDEQFTYFIIHLGYFDTNGDWQDYPNGIVK